MIKQKFQGYTAESWHIATNSAKLRTGRLVYARDVSFPYTSTDGLNYNFHDLTKELVEQILEWPLGQSVIGFCSLRFSQPYDINGLCCKLHPWFGNSIAYDASGYNLRLHVSPVILKFLCVEVAEVFMSLAAERDLSGMHEIAHLELLNYVQFAEMTPTVFGYGGKENRVPEKQPFREFDFPEGCKAFEKLRQSSFNMPTRLPMISDRNTLVGFGPMDVQ